MSEVVEDDLVHDLSEYLLLVLQAAADGKSSLEPFEGDFVVNMVGNTTDDPLRPVIGEKTPFLVVSAPPSNTNANTKIPGETTGDGNKKLYHPLDPDDARHFLSLYALTTGSPTETWPVLAPCRAAGTEPSTVLGIQRKDHGIVSFRLPLMESTSITKVSAPPLRQLVERFQATQPGNTADRMKPQARATAVYDLVGASDTPELSSVAVHFEWNDPPAAFAPPPYSATSVMQARVISGDPKSPASWLYSDLTTLCDLVNRANAIENDIEGSGIWTSGSEIRSQVTEFLDGLVVDGGRPTPPPPAVTTGGETNAGKIARRTDLDFTENLWEMCKGASGFEDLRSALAQVFRALQSGKVQPMVHKTNTTAVGMVARQCLLRATDPAVESQLRDNLLQLSTPKRLIMAVVEIGLAKLRRDYAAYFVGEELSTGQQLEYFLTDSISMDDRIVRLQQLHDVLELISVVKAYCDIPHASLRQLFQNATHHHKNTSSVEKASEDGSQVTPAVFELRFPSFSESASKVKRLCARMDPSRWTLELAAEERPHDMVSIIFATTPDNFGYSATDTTDVLDFNQTDDVNETCYFTTTLEKRFTCL